MFHLYTDPVKYVIKPTRDLPGIFIQGRSSEFRKKPGAHSHLRLAVNSIKVVRQTSVSLLQSVSVSHISTGMLDRGRE